jgi:hypothetical protein
MYLEAFTVKSCVVLSRSDRECDGEQHVIASGAEIQEVNYGNARYMGTGDYIPDRAPDIRGR